MPKTIGILGGAGPLAGAFLLDRILRLSQQKYGCIRDADFPKVVLISYPFSEMLDGNLDVPKLQEELKACLNELRLSGAEVLAIACNTLHAFLEGEEKGLVPLPKAASAKVGREMPLVLCTSTSARFDVYKQYFPCTYLDARTQEQLDRIIEEILRGSNDPTKLKEIIERQSARTVILGCTELSQFKDQVSVMGKTIIDPLEEVTTIILKDIFRS